MVRSQQAIPHVEVEAEVCTILFVMQVMVGDRVEELAKRTAYEPVWKNLVSTVAEHVERNLPNHEECKRARMNWNGEEHDWSNSGLNKCLHGLNAYAAQGLGLVER